MVSLQGTLIKHIHDYFYFFLLSSTSYYYSTLATLTSSRPKENFFVGTPLSFIDRLSCDLEIGFVTLADYSGLHAENKLSQCHKT